MGAKMDLLYMVIKMVVEKVRARHGGTCTHSSILGEETKAGGRKLNASLGYISRFGLKNKIRIKRARPDYS